MLDRVTDARIDSSRPEFEQTATPDFSDPAADLRRGIAAEPAVIPPWYLYGPVGSRLFDVITVLPEYYPTRTEAAIFDRYRHEMAAAHPVRGGTLIDLGAGSCDKAPRLFDAIEPAQYVPVDISVEFLRGAVDALQLQHPGIEMIGVGTDFSRGLALPEQVRDERRVFFYPGSSIGNFAPDEARAFIERVRDAMGDDGCLWIGVDLVKDVETLERAYDDELGVTAAFNRNLLRNVNEAAGTDFRPGEWRHYSRFDPDRSRIDMFLVSEHDTVVSWPGGQRVFSAGERIHTESSYKYTADAFRALLASAGLQTAGTWTDERGWFAVFVATLAT